MTNEEELRKLSTELNLLRVLVEKGLLKHICYEEEHCWCAEEIHPRKKRIEQLKEMAGKL